MKNVKGNQNEDAKEKRLREGRLMEYLSESVPDTDICRCVRTIANEYEEKSLPDMVKDLDWRDAKPSTLTLMKCQRIMMEYIKQKGKECHPSNLVDVKLMTTDVTVYNDGIVFKESKDNVEVEKTIASRMGVFSESNKEVMYSCATTLLAYTTHEEKKGFSNVFEDKRKTDKFLIPVIDATPQRIASGISCKSPTGFRDALYEKFMKDATTAGFLIDGIMGVTDKYRVADPTVKAHLDRAKARANEIMKAKKLPESRKKYITKEFSGYVPCCSKIKLEPSKAVVLTSVLKLKSVVEQTISFGFKGRGALTAGYVCGDLPGNHIKNLSLAKEIRFMLDTYKLKTVKLPSVKGYGLGLIKILIKNGYSVVSDKGHGMEYANGKVCAHYYTSNKPLLTIIPDCFTPYIFNSKGITFSSETYESERNIFFGAAKVHGIVAMCTHMSALLEADLEKRDSGLCFLPRVMPEDCKIWLCKGNAFNFNIKEEKIRALGAIHYRLLYPLTRRPFFSIDKWNGTIFNKPLVLPKVEIKEEKVDRYAITYIKEETIETMDFGNVYEKIGYDAQVVKASVDEEGALYDRLDSILGIVNDRGKKMSMFIDFRNGIGADLDYSEYEDDDDFKECFAAYKAVMGKKKKHIEDDAKDDEDSEADENESSVDGVGANEGDAEADFFDDDFYGESMMAIVDHDKTDSKK